MEPTRGEQNNDILYQEISRLNLPKLLSEVLLEFGIKHILDLVKHKESDLVDIFKLKPLWVRLIKYRIRECRLDWGVDQKEHERRFNSYWKNGVY